ncbi:MAG: PQQ-binding-like beta-propeller repeat protein [Clostridium sp.]|uniref:outer membrane protein assembly factor BamB family protein n=1 Tax=Clostridium sp. TaxID=1506 RepID=UPI003D6D87AF
MLLFRRIMNVFVLSVVLITILVSLSSSNSVNYNIDLEKSIITQEDTESVGIDYLCIVKKSRRDRLHKSYEDQYSAIITTNAEATNIKYAIFNGNKKINEYKIKGNVMFPLKYSEVEGVLTFRGNNLRDCASYGVANIKEKKLERLWSFRTSSSTWGGGAGWTGQPSLIKWPAHVKKFMNLEDKYKKDDNFIEVVYASLDGRIYFIDNESGSETRSCINIKNPIKGSVSLDPRGYPLLYVGQGIPEKGPIGYRIFSLINMEQLYFIDGKDPIAYRNWGAFDGAPLINSETDTLVLGGENGVFYNIKLNTYFNEKTGELKINPKDIKYIYKISGNNYQGIENSVAAYRNLVYFADNGGYIQCVDLLTMKPVWSFNSGDDTDASLTIEVENNIPYIFTGNEVDKQGARGISHIRKINGITGKLVFENAYEVMSLIGENAVNGGVLATNIIGKKSMKNLVIFTIARYKEFNSGIILAIDKFTGKEAWRFEMPNYAWSSPVDFYDANGTGYIIQCDSLGNMYLIQGETGEVCFNINLGSNIESSPAIFNDSIVVATRGGEIHCVKIK